MTQAIKTDNYFSLLGLPVSFIIDKQTLNNNYHELQRSVHPDKFANASAQQRRLSVQKAAQINDALQTLKSPTQRSIYLLSLYGIELGDNNNSIEPAFLMQQMELRESLSQVNDKADPLTELDSIMAKVKSLIKQTINTLDDVFASLFQEQKVQDQKVQQEQDALLKKATSETLKMQFLNRLQEECLNKEEDLTA